MTNPTAKESEKCTVVMSPGRGEKSYYDQLPDLKRSKCHLLLVIQVLECPTAEWGGSMQSGEPPRIQAVSGSNPRPTTSHVLELSKVT